MLWQLRVCSFFKKPHNLAGIEKRGEKRQTDMVEDEGQGSTDKVCQLAAAQIFGYTSASKQVKRAYQVQWEQRKWLNDLF